MIEMFKSFCKWTINDKKVKRESTIEKQFNQHMLGLFMILCLYWIGYFINYKIGMIIALFLFLVALFPTLGLFFYKKGVK